MPAFPGLGSGNPSVLSVYSVVNADRFAFFVPRFTLRANPVDIDPLGNFDPLGHKTRKTDDALGNSDFLYTGNLAQRRRDAEKKTPE